MALVVLRRYAMLSEAHAAAAALRASGLYPVLLDDAAAPPYSGMPVMGGYRLAVSDDEAKDAVEVLRAALASPADAEGAAPPEMEDAPGWEDTADAARPVMPAARRIGRMVVWAWFLLFAALIAFDLWGVRASGD